MIDPSRDAFGAALLDYLKGRDVPELVLEEEGGETGPALHPEWFFRGFEQWDRPVLRCSGTELNTPPCLTNPASGV